MVKAYKMIREEAIATPSRVLVVEDYDVARKEIVRALRKRGFSVVEASDGGAAIAEVKAEAVDVVLMDIRLGDGPDGIDAALEMQRSNPLSSFIFVSAYLDEVAYKRVAESGIRVEGWVEKPFKVGDLMPLLEEAQRKIRLLQQSDRAKE